MKFLAISGSLRARSTNTVLLHAAALVAPPSVKIEVYGELASIPSFNPDLDVEPGPEPVERFRAAIRASAAVIFSTPEYAHGLPGSLKNALDWVVGSGELSGKPVALLNASARGEFAQSSLREVLKTMDARLLSDAEATVALLGKALSPSEIAADPGFAAAITGCLRRVGSAI